MWMFEKRGFVSVVAYDPKKDRNKSSKFPEIAMRGKEEYDHSHLLVRARIKEDLEMLKLVVPSLHVETDKSADYSFRAIITRKQMKKFLARAVDDLDYDSHFKEVARDNSPKAEGRYSAMMSIWSAMAKLQPYSPYGGYSGSSSYWGGSYSSGYGTSVSSKSKDGSKSTSANVSVLGGGSSQKKPQTPMESGAKDLETFLKNYVDSNGEKTFKTGAGPLTGYKKDDKVTGYFGDGTVVKVESRGEGKADMVSVRYTIKTNTTTITKNANFLSNYLIPTDLPEISEEEGNLDDELIDGSLDVDWTYDYLALHTDVHAFPSDVISMLDDNAFELLTRSQEAVNEGVRIDTDTLNRIYDEILWECADDEERKRMFNDGVVPDKFADEAVKLFASKA